MKNTRHSEERIQALISECFQLFARFKHDELIPEIQHRLHELKELYMEGDNVQIAHVDTVGSILYLEWCMDETSEKFFHVDSFWGPYFSHPRLFEGNKIFEFIYRSIVIESHLYADEQAKAIENLRLLLKQKRPTDLRDALITALSTLQDYGEQQPQDEVLTEALADVCVELMQLKKHKRKRMRPRTYGDMVDQMRRL